MHFNLNDNKLLYSKESGFWSMHSVPCFLLKCIIDWYLNLEKGSFTSVTFINLKKAFNTLNYDILLKKIYLYEINIANFTAFGLIFRTENNV